MAARGRPAEGKSVDADYNSANMLPEPLQRAATGQVNALLLRALGNADGVDSPVGEGAQAGGREGVSRSVVEVAAGLPLPVIDAHAVWI